MGAILIGQAQDKYRLPVWDRTDVDLALRNGSTAYSPTLNDDGGSRCHSNLSLSHQAARLMICPRADRTLLRRGVQPVWRLRSFGVPTQAPEPDVCSRRGRVAADAAKRTFCGTRRPSSTACVLRMACTADQPGSLPADARLLPWRKSRSKARGFCAFAGRLERLSGAVWGRTRDVSNSSIEQQASPLRQMLRAISTRPAR